MKRASLLILAIVILGTAFLSCGNQPKRKEGELSGAITISGAFALYPLVVKWAEEFKKENPGVRIDISAGGAGKGMTDALARVADLGMVSRDVYPSEIEKGAVEFAVAKDAVVPTISTENPLLSEIMRKGLSREAARQLWVNGNFKTWEQLLGISGNTPVHVYTRSDACGAAETWADWMGVKQEDLGGTAVFGDPGLAMAVQKDKVAIGFNNLSYAYDEKSRKLNPGITIIPMDVNNDGIIDDSELFYETKDQMIAAIAEDRYPSPPARDLYLVSNGIPEKPEVIAFLQYILTKGQEHNVPVGYIGLSQEKLDVGLKKLEQVRK